MKQINGTILYFNLGLAILWDILGLLLLVISLIPIVQVFGIILSIVLDMIALTSSIILSTLYKVQVGTFYVNLKAYQAQEIVKLTQLQSQSKTSSPQASILARKAKELGNQMIESLKKYFEEVVVQAILYSLYAWVMELIPLLGDLSPTWTIKAWTQLQKHKKRNAKIKDQVEKFEARLNQCKNIIRSPFKSSLQVIQGRKAQLSVGA